MVVFTPDGTLTATNLTIDDDSRRPTLDGTGSWSLLPHDDGLGDTGLGFDRAHYSTYMNISGSRTKPMLYWFVDDPDLCDLRRFDRE